MWNRKEIKKEGQQKFIQNFIACVCVCFLLAFLGCEFTSSTRVIHGYDNEKTIPENVINTTEHITNTNIFGGEDTVFTTVAESYSSAASYLFKLAGSVKEAINIEFTGATILALVSMIELLYILFISNPFIVGSRRFFIKNRTNPKTKIREVLNIYKQKSLLNVVKTMFLQALYLILWFFTIIGFCIKIYEYRMIPFILAENPKLKTKEVFKRSKQMMMGNKWEMFKFDLSYVGWKILDILTLGLSGILYSNPYKLAATTEIYCKIKA